MFDGKERPDQVDAQDFLPLLDRLLRIPAPSGYEEPAARAWREEASFAQVSRSKPPSSRRESSEFFLVARGRKA